jgi:membrane protein YdbS with pleckstrin-like domain
MGGSGRPDGLGLGTVVHVSQPIAPPLRPPRHRVNPRARGWWTVRALLSVGAALAAEATALALVGISAGSSWLVATLAGTALAGAGYVVIMPRWRYRIHRWEADDEAVYTLTGWIRREWRIAPISRIQTIDTALSPLQRLFGLASVTLTTASSAGPVRIEGLDADAAAELARQLTEITQAHPGDAT